MNDEFRVNTYTNNSQPYPSIANLSNGKFVVTWSSLEQDGWGWGIYGQIFNNNGTLYGSEFQVNTYTANYQVYSAVADLGNEKFVVTWDSNE